MSVSAHPRSKARALRAALTPAEKVAWRTLRAGELAALNWRRQAPFQHYVLDFVSYPARLVVEIDGCHHAERGQAAHDARRTMLLKSHGYRVLRFWNNDVLRDADALWRTVHEAASHSLAQARMKRWRASEGERVRQINSAAASRSISARWQDEQSACLPLDGGGGRAAAGGGERVAFKNKSRETLSASVRPTTPQSARSADSSPIEGERGASTTDDSV